MTSCGFEDLAGPGKPHQGLTGPVESPDDPDVRFTCLMRRNVLSAARVSPVCGDCGLGWRVSAERRRDKVWYGPRRVDGRLGWQGDAGLRRGGWAEFYIKRGPVLARRCAEVGTRSVVRPG